MASGKRSRLHSGDSGIGKGQDLCLRECQFFNQRGDLGLKRGTAIRVTPLGDFRFTRFPIDPAIRLGFIKYLPEVDLQQRAFDPAVFLNFFLRKNGKIIQRGFEFFVGLVSEGEVGIRVNRRAGFVFGIGFPVLPIAGHDDVVEFVVRIGGFLCSGSLTGQELAKRDSEEG